MSTAAQYRQQPSHPHSQAGLLADTYDPDDVVPRDSPLMTPLRPRIEPTPSPPPDIPLAQVRPSSGDAVLVASLDGGRHHDVLQVLVDDHESLHDDSSNDVPPDISADGTPYQKGLQGHLRNLAAGALEVALAADSPATSNAGHDISVSTRQLSLHDNQSKLPGPSEHHSVQKRFHYPTADSRPITRSPPTIAASASGELPPLRVDSPRNETNGQQLPSIRSTFGDIKRLPTEGLVSVDKDLAIRHAPTVAFPHSPPTGVHRLPPMTAAHVSPPISPNDGYPRNLPSPHSLSSTSPFHFSNGLPSRSSVDYSSSTTGETPSTDQSGSTPATSASVADRMSIDGLTNPQVGAYMCTFAGCNAPPFQTQYLLNSHANVHSSARPHYCPVQGCPRSEGGKGFKRKNEMIRHGLVHDSPGYVCPFCPDREHKYPRPDNLQRHVRVHHIDKDKDDPLLREVLSQRPDGPNRGRRRRGPAS